MDRAPQPSHPGQPGCQYSLVSPRGHVACGVWPARPYRVTGIPAGGRATRLIRLCRRHLAEVLAAAYQASRAAPEALHCEHRVAGHACAAPAREVRVEGVLAGVRRPCPAHEEAPRTPGYESSICRPSLGSAPVAVPADVAWSGQVPIQAVVGRPERRTLLRQPRHEQIVPAYRPPDALRC